MTTVTTSNPVRTDVSTTPTRTTRRTSSPGSSRTWAWSGVAAGVLAIGTMVSSSTINAVYDKAIAQDEDAILAKLADQSAQIVVFQVVARPHRARPGRLRGDPRGLGPDVIRIGRHGDHFV